MLGIPTTSSSLTVVNSILGGGSMDCSMAAEGGVCEVDDDEPSCVPGDPLESVKIERRADSSSEKGSY